MSTTIPVAHKWARDRTNLSEHLIREELIRLSREILERADACPDENERKRLFKFARGLQDRRALTKALPGLQAHPALTLAEEQFDAAPTDLNSPAGIVDLRTGRTRRPDPAALCARATAVAPAPGEPTNWLRVVTEAVRGDLEVLGFLQVLFGYALTGLNVEKILPVVYGPPDTSKSLVERVTRTLAGDYHATIPHGELFETRSDRHPTGLKKFATSRYATSSEIPPRSRWRTDIVKAFTGGDRVPVRGMRQDWQDADPTCLMILFGNHLPSTDGADPALLRRIVPIPFRHQIPEAEQDEHLAEKLIRNEGPQILQWIIAGARRYFEEGLTLPAAIQAERAEYAAGEDLLSAFIAECCIEEPEGEATTADLREGWRRWCHKHGHTEQAKASTIAFGRMLKPVAEAKGWGHSVNVGPDRTRGYVGVELRDSMDSFEAPAERAVKASQREYPDA